MNEDNFSKKISDLEQNLDRLKVAEPEMSQAKKDKLAGERVFAEIVGGMLFGVVFGLMLDDYFNTAPIFLLVLLILGLAGSVYNIYKATK